MSQTGSDKLPTEFPVFPLGGALLLPQGKLPLNIFEPRYRAMVEDALAAGRVIGMVQPDENRPQTPSGPALYRVGCLGRLSSFNEADDGRYLITLTGMVRFAISVELEMQRGYRRVRADLARFRDDLDDKPAASAIDRDALTRALRTYFNARGFDANWDAINELPDNALVVTLAMVCPFDPVEKQALLEAPTPGNLASTLLTLLQMGAHATDAGRQGRSVS